MHRDHIKIILIGIATLVQLGVKAQLKIDVGNPDPADSVNLDITRKVVALLEQQNISKAISYFKFRTDEERKNMVNQLKEISKDLQLLKPNTKVFFQTSYKNYKDSFNINQAIFYNDEGRYYLFELFFSKADTSSKVVNVFVKDPALLEKKRNELAEFRKKNPGVPLPPQSLPPGVYKKENNYQ